MTAWWFIFYLKRTFHFPESCLFFFELTMHNGTLIGDKMGSKISQFKIYFYYQNEGKLFFTKVGKCRIQSQWGTCSTLRSYFCHMQRRRKNKLMKRNFSWLFSYFILSFFSECLRFSGIAQYFTRIFVNVSNDVIFYGKILSLFSQFAYKLLVEFGWYI